MPATAEALALALHYHKTGAKPEAELLCREILQTEPAQPDALQLLGQMALEVGKNELAVQYLAQAAAAAPGNSAYHSNLGLAYQNLGRLVEAEASFRQALRLQPNFPEVHHNLANVLQDQGKYDEAITHYRQALLGRPNLPEAHFRLGTAMQTKGQLNEAVAHYRQALLLRPNYAVVHVSLGSALHDQKKFEDAIAHYRQALLLRPNNAAAHNNLGNTLQEVRKFDEAISHYKQALQVAPNFAEAYNNMANALQALDKFEECIPHYQHALRLKPDYFEAHSNLGGALAGIGRFDEALASYGQAIRIKQDYADAHWNRSLAWLLLGDFEGGLAEYEWRRRRPGFVLTTLGKPFWDGSPLHGKTLLVTAEQGLGDSFQFVRYLRLVKERFGGRLFFWCQKPVVPLFEHSNLGIDGLIPWGAQPPDVDVQIPLASLPHFMGTTLHTIPTPIPYIHPRPDLVEQWKRELRASGGEAFHIGIGWQGNPQFAKDRSRSFPLKHFAALARVPGVQLYSLQKGFGSEQVQQVAGEFSVIDLAARLDEGTGAFMDTAAVMKNLDLVVTSDTAIAHLAGALGVPVWVAISYIPDWRWMMQRDDSPWYPSMRLFRQRQAGDWAELFDRIAAELTKRTTKRSGVRSVSVEIAPGELLDKITILQIKSERITDEGKLQHVNAELVALRSAQQSLPSSDTLAGLTAELRQVNEKLWDIEDKIRVCEAHKDFGPVFIELARSVYHENDRRALLKRKINELLGAAFIEQKSYTHYS